MISIVIPAYNEEKVIAKTLQSLVAQQYAEQFEVIVVDNNSTDKTADVAQTFAASLTIRVIHESRKGRGAARATGFTAAHGDIILSTDADTVVPSDWIMSMTRPFADSRVIATTGTMCIDDCTPFANWLVNSAQPISMRAYRMLMGHYWLSGFNFSIRKDAYTRSGGFKPNLSAHEDTELAMRVQHTGIIRFIARCPVLVSGRRFQGGVLRGLLVYPLSFIDHYILKREAHLSDLR